MAKHIRAQKIRLHMHLHWKKCQLLCFSLIYYFSASHSDKSQQYIWITKQKHFIAICTKFKMYREWAKHSKDCCCCIKCLLKSKIMWTMCSSFGLSFSLFLLRDCVAVCLQENVCIVVDKQEHYLGDKVQGRALEYGQNIARVCCCLLLSSPSSFFISHFSILFAFHFW